MGGLKSKWQEISMLSSGLVGREEIRERGSWNAGHTFELYRTLRRHGVRVRDEY